MSFQDDDLLRMIEHVAEALRRKIGLGEKRDFAAELDAVAEGWTDVLGVPRALVDHVDRRTLGEPLRDPAKIRAAAHLFELEADVHAAARDDAAAARCRARAQELLR